MDESFECVQFAGSVVESLDGSWDCSLESEWEDLLSCQSDHENKHSETPAPAALPKSTKEADHPAIKKTCSGMGVFDKAPRKKVSRRIYEPDVKEYFEPNDKDVLFGRGGRTNSHPGNRRFHEQKLKFHEAYVHATRAEKKIHAKQLVDAVHRWGGQFLAQDHKGWYKVHFKRASTKASQALRETKEI